MRHFFVVCAWMFLSVGAILASVACLQFFKYFQPNVAALETPTIGQVASAQTEAPPPVTSAPEAEPAVSVEVADARHQLVANFLKRHNSPMQPADYYGQKLVEIADRYEIDFRLLPAIAMQESNLCKVIPENSYNCLGFGVHSKGTLRFSSYEEAFETAARVLKKNYIDQGLTTPEEIMRKYTPSSNGSWAASVNQWMAEMRYDDRAKGRTHKTDADLLEFVEE